MIKVQWIVENFTHESSYTDIVKAIKEEGHSFHEITNNFAFADIDEYDGELPVIFCGSIKMTELVQSRLRHCFPVSYCNQDNYLCSKYMTYFGKYLFNDRYIILSLNELRRNKWLYYGIFGKEALIFIRPDSGQKPFQAQLLDLLDFDRFVIDNQIIGHDLVIVSSPKKILWEGRFVVSRNKEVIAHSTYRFQDQITKISSVPEGAMALCKELLEVGYYPDSVFCIDICQDAENDFWLLELNSFSSAGLYECNKKQIVQKVSEIAADEWDRWYKNFTHA